MLSEKITEKLAEVLVDRIEELNTTILEEVGNSIKELGKLMPNQAYKLIEDIKFGGSYNKIIKKLAKITNMNERDILKILEEVAIQDQNFAKQFYEYRKKDFIPYEKNTALQNQVKAIAKLTQNTYKNLMNTSAMVLDNKYVSLGNIYQKALDRAVISIAQGKDTYQTQMRKIIKEMADKGIRTRTDREGNNTYVKVVDYKSGTSRRLDSAVRMSIMDGMKTLSNEIQKQFGEEFDADGIEISVHEHPAEDHEDIQGHQYSNKEFEKLNNSLERPISTLNCQHYIFSIVLGVSKPEYTQEQLNKIKKDNKTGFSFEGKHYTLYEGTQLQRQIETKIRTLKDRQIGLKALGDYEEVGNCQRQITQLTHKYNDLCKASGLKPKKQRMSVSGYVRTKVNNIKEKAIKPNEIFISKKENEELANYYINAWEKYSYLGSLSENYQRLLKQKEKGFKDEVIDLSTFEGCDKLLEKINGKLYGEEIKNMDINLISDATKTMYEAVQKCPALKSETRDSKLILKAGELKDKIYAQTRFTEIELNSKYFKNKNILQKEIDEAMETKEYVSGYNSWFSQTAKGNETKQIINHEIGHIVQKSISHDIAWLKNNTQYFQHLANDVGAIPVKEVRKELMEEPIRRVMKIEKLTREQVIKKYVSIYGQTDIDEMFAETYSKNRLGKSNILADELMKYLKEIGEWTD